MASSKVASGRMPSVAKSKFLFSRRDTTFIVPTSFGLVFGLMALLLFFIALGYQNNIVYIFVFFIASVGHTTMLLTNRNIQRLKILNAYALECVAHSPSELLVEIENKSKVDSQVVGVRIPESKVEKTDLRVPAKQTITVSIPWLPERRGWVQPPRLEVESRYPFDLLRAWRVFQAKSKVLVYPQSRGPLPLPHRAGANHEPEDLLVFKEISEFQRGDSPRRVDWRTSAKRQSLFVRRFENSKHTVTLDLDWSLTATLTNLEDRISQLAKWVDEAEQGGFNYSLTIPQTKLRESSGREHRKKCLSLLALYSPEETI